MSRPRLPQEHLGDRLSDYVDRVLPTDELRAADRHLVACVACRAGAEEERRLLASLRRTQLPPGRDLALQQMLLALASEQSVGSAPSATVGARRPSRLVVLPCAAPAMHRSARHSVACAGLTVAACAVAAWTVAAGQPVVRPATTAPATTAPATTPAVGPIGLTEQGSWSQMSAVSLPSWSQMSAVSLPSWVGAQATASGRAGPDSRWPVLP